MKQFNFEYALTVILIDTIFPSLLNRATYMMTKFFVIFDSEKKKYMIVKLGDRGGQSMGPRHPNPLTRTLLIP